MSSEDSRSLHASYPLVPLYVTTTFDQSIMVCELILDARYKAFDLSSRVVCVNMEPYYFSRKQGTGMMMERKRLLLFLCNERQHRQTFCT